MRTAVFVGSFDPYTIGHHSILTRALPLFDKIVVGVVGDNVNKPYLQPAEERMKAIEELYADEPRVEVKPYYGLAADFARQNGAPYIIKGIRSAADLEHERPQADINRQLTGVETVFLLAEPELQSISSSMVRELQHFGQDVSPYLPKRK